MALLFISLLQVLALLIPKAVTGPIQPRSSSISISVPSTRPANAYNVPADFVGFGFSSAQLDQYDNTFSNNLVNSVAKRMSLPPIIRVGGTDGDTIKVDPNQTTNATCSGPQCPNGFRGARYTVGPSYFDGFKSFKMAKFSFQAPFQPNNISDSVSYCTYAYNALGFDRISAIAIGNEPTISPDKVRDVNTYVKDALKIQAAVIEALNLSGDQLKIFEVPDLPTHYSDEAEPWTLPDAFRAGLDKNGYVKIAAAHYYQVVTGEPADLYGGKAGTNFQVQIMSHASIEKHFAPYINSIKFLKGKVPYVLSETGSSLVGNIGFINSFGDTLWKVDFQLYAMSKGVARVAGSQRPTVPHQLWMPYQGGSQDPIGVRATYYAQPFIADFIGKSANTWVTDLNLGMDYFSAYAAYDNESLVRIALVNLVEWKSKDGSRPSTQVTLDVPSGVSSVKVASLAAADGASALGYDLGGSGQTITWAGETWSYSQDNGNGHMVSTASTTVQASNGKVVISVPNSEAVVVSL